MSPTPSGTDSGFDLALAPFTENLREHTESWCGIHNLIIKSPGTFSIGNNHDSKAKECEMSFLQQAGNKLTSSDAYWTAYKSVNTEGVRREWYNSVHTVCEEVRKEGGLNIPGICLKTIHLYKDTRAMRSAMDPGSPESHLIPGTEYTLQAEGINEHKKFVMEPVGSAPG